MKPIVRYVDIVLPLGIYARVCVLDHPRFPPRTWVWTGTVRHIHRQTANGPVFETNRTIYEPAGTDESLSVAGSQPEVIASPQPHLVA